MSTASAPSRKRFHLAGVALVILAGGAFLTWFMLQPKPHVRPNEKPPDMDIALEANLRGVGCMDRFEYDRAVTAFEEVVRNAPDWTPGSINLALALLNQAGNISDDGGKRKKLRDELFARAIKLYEDLLEREKDKRWQTYAHYGLGVIYLTLNQNAMASQHLEKAHDLDSADPHTLFRYAKTFEHSDPKKAADFFRRALESDPYLGAAVYAYSVNKHIRRTEPDRIKVMGQEHLRMSGFGLYNSSDDKHSELGYYGEPIGRPAREAKVEVVPAPVFLPADPFTVHLAEGTRWATAKDDAGDRQADELRRRLRQRFGGVLVLLDFDRDGRLDVFLIGAVVRKGRVGNLLLHNEGKGNFRDVTDTAGLAGAHASIGCSVTDFDNDTFPDLFLTGAGEPRLFRNRGNGTFDDVTKKAGLDRLEGVSLSAAFVDIDQDGDLDLLVTVWGKSAAQALKLLDDPSTGGASLRLFANNGTAWPGLAHRDPPALTPGFVPVQLDAFAIDRPIAGLTISDIDLDQDVDVLTLPEGSPATVILNDRLLRFRRATLPEDLGTKGSWNGAAVLDVNRDERSDLLLIGPKQEPLLLLHEPVVGPPKVEKLYRKGMVRSRPLLQAQAIDLDLDGKTDVLGIAADRLPAWLRNEDNQLVDSPSMLGDRESWPADLLAIVAADLDGDGKPDLLAWSEEKGLLLRLQHRNERKALLLDPNGHRRVHVETGGDISRCNADGFGLRVSAQASDHWTELEFGTLFAGLGQSHVPLVLGMGKHPKAQVVRLRWPDNVRQAELDLALGEVKRVEQTQRKLTSCPVLFTWNGSRFVFVTDFLGAGTLGEMQPDGTHRPPRPEESVKIEGHQLAPKDGAFLLRIAEPMDEVTYLDRLQLLAIDHPENSSVYPDERMSTDATQPSQALLAYEKQLFPVKAINHRGKDVTTKLRKWDRDMVDEFAWRLWIGFAEDHWIDLDFGEQLKDVTAQDRLYLFAAGSTEYAYPESIWAANQAGVKVQPPVLERQGADGKWHPIAEIGFPAGMPRMMSFDLTGKLAGERGSLRLRTNLQIFWDQLFLARIVDRPVQHVSSLEVSAAKLYYRGFMQEYSPDGKLPTLYDPDRLAPMAVNSLRGKLTRYGDVTELLRETDDRFVLIGPGDEAEIKFDAKALPVLKPGWKRSYVLRTWGYCKDTGPFTATGSTVEPLPFRAMTTYPYGAKEKYPDSPRHRDYLRQYNTRKVGP